MFVLIFWSCRENSLIRKIRLISKSGTSKPGYQTITIHILPNIPRIKGNQTIKSGQLNKMLKNEVGSLVVDLFLFFKKALYDVKASGLQLSFNIF